MWSVADRKYPEKTPKKGHKSVNNQNFEKLIKASLDILLKMIFSKNTLVPMSELCTEGEQDSKINENALELPTTRIKKI